MLTKKQFRQVERNAIAVDESDLWPINGQFNVTKRAINRIHRQCGGSPVGYFDSPDAYRKSIDLVISEIVNDSSQW